MPTRQVLNKFIQSEDPYRRESDCSQDLEMAILTDNIVGIGNNGTIDKFIVVGVLLNQMKTKLRCKE